MYFHIILTEACNSQCRYCYGKSEKDFGDKLNKTFKFDFSGSCEFNLDAEELRQFVLKDNDPRIIFYGGEPLMKINKIVEIMDKIPEARFYIQTNGKLFHKLPAEYTNRFSKILISIDGDKERTDFNRGDGTYDLVLKNLKLIKENDFRGEVVARMTISFSDGFADLTKQVRHLFEIGFDSVHWQLDMGFYEFDYNKEKVETFIEEYNKEVLNLINFWVNKIKQGKVLKIYPFLGIFDSLYHNTTTKLRCGSGYVNYTITPSGKITCCPIMDCITDFYVGDIKESDPNKLKEISVTEPCPLCDYFDLCGGRCLYSNHAKLWPEEGEKQICSAIKFLIDEMKKQIPEIEMLINQQIVTEEQFNYEKYFGPEIIP